MTSSIPNTIIVLIVTYRAAIGGLDPSDFPLRSLLYALSIILSPMLIVACDADFHTDQQTELQPKIIETNIRYDTQAKIIECYFLLSLRQLHSRVNLAVLNETYTGT